MISNCYFWARDHYQRRRREWIDAGERKGWEPYISKRPTRLRLRAKTRLGKWMAKRLSRIVPHYIVRWRDLQTGETLEASFGPENRVYDLPIWKLPIVILFKGRVIFGDGYKSTAPPVI